MGSFSLYYHINHTLQSQQPPRRAGPLQAPSAHTRLILWLFFRMDESNVHISPPDDFNLENRESCNVSISEQPCTVNQNMTVLNDMIDKKSHFRKDYLLGLRAVLEVLLSTVYIDGKETLKSFLSMQDALELFCGYIPEFTPGPVNKEINAQFRYLLLNKKVGLCVLIINNSICNTSYICLRPEVVNMVGIFEAFINDHASKMKSVESERLLFNEQTVNSLLQTMDSEWDKTVAKGFLCANISRSNIARLGLQPDKITQLVDRLKYVGQEVNNTQLAANDIVDFSLNEKADGIKKQIDSMKKNLEQKRNFWPVEAIHQKENNIEDMEKQLQNLHKLLNPVSREDHQRLKRKRKRVAVKLHEDNRIKRRRLTNQGAPRLIDSEAEEFVACAVEDKGTCHGRRHNMTMYTNRRVKKQDFLNIANYHLGMKNKKMIKSATTIFNRGKAKHSRSRQALKHIGKNLFCCRKPPKAEDCDNENTHYQRALVKYVKFSYWGNGNIQNRHGCYMESTDDKAYIRPGTSEGFRSSRKGGIYCLTDEEKARKLPKYDWPEKMVYQTPASHRVFTKEEVIENNKETLSTAEDYHVVFVLPKNLIKSSGSTYRSQTVFMRTELPDLYDIPNGTDYSVQFRSACALLHDYAKLYSMMTVKYDLDRVTNAQDCPHRIYEMSRLRQLENGIDKAASKSDQISHEAEREIFAARLLPSVTLLKGLVSDNLKLFSTLQFEPEDAVTSSDDVQRKCQGVLQILIELNLPVVKSRWADLTDGGPGQAVNNFDVQFRDAELAILYNSDHRIRVHRSRGDSGQGEAERTNSAISDSVVDGGTIHWELFKRYEGMTKEEKESMSLQEYEDYETKRMEKNAWAVTHELVNRIHGAPVLGTYIKCFPSEKPGEFFFFNDTLLHEYAAASSATRETLPGSGYIQKIVTFFESHYIRGELFMEYLKHSCSSTQNNELCFHCSTNDWVLAQIPRIPHPIPDEKRKGHYKSLNDCIEASASMERHTDDYQPRVNIKKMFDAGDLSSDNLEQIKIFSEKFAVEEKHVRSQLVHFEHLKLKDSKRKDKRRREKDSMLAKTYDDYKWKDLAESHQLKNLRVSELDKYLDKHKLNKRSKKAVKVKTILCHLLRTDVLNIESDHEEEYDSEEDDEITDSTLYLDTNDVMEESHYEHADSDKTSTDTESDSNMDCDDDIESNRVDIQSENSKYRNIFDSLNTLR